MYNIKIRDINPTARYNVTMTAYDDSADVETKTMDGETLIAMINGCAHLYDIDAELIPAEPETTAETTETAQGTQDAEQAAGTTETAEPEQNGRDARIDEIARAVCHEIVASDYRKKQRVTAKRIREAERAGVPTVRMGYCVGQSLLRDIEPDYYTAGIYGWNFDVYQIAGLTICTGYRGMIGAKAVKTAKYEARIIDECTPFKRAKILAEWIAANLDALQAAREGARV